MLLKISNEHTLIVWFQKISILTPWKVIDNSKGEGVSTAKIYKGDYEAKMEIPGGREGSNEKPSIGEVWIFSGTTHFHRGVPPGGSGQNANTLSCKDLI